MDAIKKILSPGKSKDDEVMYGDRSNAGTQDPGSGAYTQGVPQGADAPTLYTDPEAKKNEHGILKQIFNPGGEKYDESRFQGTATTDPSTLSSTPANDQNEHGVLRQIINPGGDKYDDVRYGSAGGPSGASEVPGALPTGSGAPQIEPLPAADDKQGMLRQVLNPGGEKHDDMRYGSTGNVIPGTDSLHSGAGPDDGSALSIKSGVLGPYASTTDQNPSGSGSGSGSGPTAYSAAGSSTQGRDTQANASTEVNPHSGFGHDAALGGAIAAGGGAGALAHDTESGQHQKHDTMQNDDLDKATYTERSFPLTGGTSSTSHPAAPASSSISDSYKPTATSAYNQPSTSTGTGNNDYRVAEAGALGGVTALGAGGLAAHEHDKHHDQPSELPAELPSSSTAPMGSTETAAQSGPIHDQQDGAAVSSLGAAGTGSSGDTSSETPHIPGEFPSEDGTDPHHSSGAGGFGGANTAQIAAREAMKRHGGPASTSTSKDLSPSTVRGLANQEVKQTPPVSERHPEHHYGRDAVVAGGVGAAGAGAYEAAKHHEHNAPTSTTSQATGLWSSTNEPSAAGLSSTAPGRTGANSSGPSSFDPAPTTTGAHGTTSPPSSSYPSAPQDHHYGRDAALAGGAGAAGLGAYEAEQHHQRAEPTSTSSTGVEPQSQYSAPTAANDASTAARQTQSEPVPKEHHYGRDAALAGGAGAAGIGAYETGQHHDPSGPASKTVGPHDSNVANVLDPRAQPEPQYMKQSTTTGPHESDTLNKLDPRVKNDVAQSEQGDAKQQQPQDHHYGRDAAVAGGVGAAGAGAYEAEKHHGRKDPSSTGVPPNHSEQTGPEQQQDRHYGRDAAVAGGVGAAGAGAYEAEKHHGRKDPSSSTGAAPTQFEQTDPKQQQDRHYGRDAAVAGGVGAASAGAYEAEKHHDPRDSSSKGTESSSAGGQQKSSFLSKLDPRSKKDTAPSEQKDPKQQPQDHHYGRDAAVAGGVGAAGAGAYEAEKHHDSKDPSSQGTEPTSKSGFLSKLDPRSKKDTAKSDQADPEQQQDHHYGRDAAVAGGVGAAGAGAYEAEKHHGHSSRHHEPASAAGGATAAAPYQSDSTGRHDARTQPDAHQSQEKDHHYGRDGAVAGAGTGAAAYEAHEHDNKHHDRHQDDKHREGHEHEKKHHNKLHKDPPSEKKEGFLHKILHPGKKDKHEEAEPSSPSAGRGQHDAEAAGATGAMGGAGEYESGSHDPDYQRKQATGAGTGEQQGDIVTDPHTGLPMNVGQYGSGAGGTDGAQNIEGYHSHEQGGADWRDIQKANTPY